MEEEILKILRSGLHSMAGYTWLIGLDDSDCDDAAKETTIMVMEYVMKLMKLWQTS